MTDALNKPLHLLTSEDYQNIAGAEAQWFNVRLKAMVETAVLELPVAAKQAGADRDQYLIELARRHEPTAEELSNLPALTMEGMREAWSRFGHEHAEACIKNFGMEKYAARGVNELHYMTIANSIVRQDVWAKVAIGVAVLEAAPLLGDVDGFMNWLEMNEGTARANAADEFERLVPLVAQAANDVRSTPGFGQVLNDELRDFTRVYICDSIGDENVRALRLTAGLGRIAAEKRIWGEYVLLARGGGFDVASKEAVLRRISDTVASAIAAEREAARAQSPDTHVDFKKTSGKEGPDGVWSVSLVKFVGKARTETVELKALHASTLDTKATAVIERAQRGEPLVFAAAEVNKCGNMGLPLNSAAATVSKSLANWGRTGTLRMSKVASQ